MIQNHGQYWVAGWAFAIVTAILLANYLEPTIPSLRPVPVVLAAIASVFFLSAAWRARRNVRRAERRAVLQQEERARQERLYSESAERVKELSERANDGDHGAQAELGTFFESGMGVPQDSVRAYMWYQLAANWGDSQASRRRDALARAMSSAQITDAQHLAVEWQTRRSLQGERAKQAARKAIARLDADLAIDERDK